MAHVFSASLRAASVITGSPLFCALLLIWRFTKLFRETRFTILAGRRHGELLFTYLVNSNQFFPSDNRYSNLPSQIPSTAPILPILK
jgi:hypothetical protein